MKTCSSNSAQEEKSPGPQVSLASQFLVLPAILTPIAINSLPERWTLFKHRQSMHSCPQLLPFDNAFGKRAHAKPVLITVLQYPVQLDNVHHTADGHLACFRVGALMRILCTCYIICCCTHRVACLGSSALVCLATQIYRVASCLCGSLEFVFSILNWWWEATACCHFNHTHENCRWRLLKKRNRTTGSLSVQTKASGHP